MVNPDLLISVGIWVSGVGMSAVGIEMTVRPPNEQSKWWYRGIFISLGLMFVGLGVWQFDRADKESKRQAEAHQQEQLRNEGNLKFVQGQLDSISKVLGTLSSNSNSSQTLAALRAVLPTITSGRPAIELMSNKQLRIKVIEFCKQLRELVERHRQQQTQVSTQEQGAMSEVMPFDRALTEEERKKANKIWSDYTQRISDVEIRFQREYEDQFSVSARMYRDELLRRLGPQPPEMTHPFGWASSEVAEYLERLARKLPD